MGPDDDGWTAQTADDWTVQVARLLKPWIPRVDAWVREVCKADPARAEAALTCDHALTELSTEVWTRWLTHLGTGSPRESKLLLPVARERVRTFLSRSAVDQLAELAL